MPVRSEAVRSIVVLLVLAVSLVMAVGSRLYSVGFYWWLAIFRPQDWVFIDISALNISLLAGLIVIVGCLLTGNLPQISGLPTALMIVMLLLLVLASEINGCAPAWDWVDYFFRLTVVLLITNRLIRDPRAFSIIVMVFGLSLGFYASKAGLSSILAGGTSQYGIANLTGSFTDSNGFAHGTAVLVFFMLASAFSLHTVFGKYVADEHGADNNIGRLMRYGIIGIALLSSFNVMSLGSRGSALALAGGWFMFIAFRRGGLARMFKLLPVAVVLALVVPLPQGFEERIASVFADEEEIDASAASRPHLWSVAVLMAQSHPLGVGAQCYTSYYDRFDPSNGQFGKRKAVHSVHFQALANTGYAGALVWIVLALATTSLLLAVRRRSQHLALTLEQQKFLEINSSSLLCALAVFYVGGSFYNHMYVEYFWIIPVLAESLSRISLKMIADSGDRPESSGRTGPDGGPRKFKSIYDRR